MIKKETINLKNTIKKMEDKHGKGIVMKLDDSLKSKIDIIPTGSICLNHALGVGGIPRGRIIEIFGPESSGKTTLALHIIAEAQKQNLICAFVDAEHALDIDYAKKLGVDAKELYLSQPGSGEQALDVVENFVKSNEVGLIVIDSVAALTPQAEIDGDMGAHHIGLQARLMSQALRKLTAITSNAKTTIIFINQIRINIGQTWGNPEVTSGGKALHFYASMRIEVRRAARLTKNDEVIGNRVKVKIAKNKLAAPFKITEFDIIYNEGISKTADVLNFGLIHNIIEKSGNTLSFEKEKIAAGLERAKKVLKEKPELLQKIIDECNKLI